MQCAQLNWTGKRVILDIQSCASLPPNRRGGTITISIRAMLTDANLIL